MTAPFPAPVELVIGGFILFLAAVIGRFSSDRASRLWLALFLVAVGANHLILGVGQALSLWTQVAVVGPHADIGGAVQWFSYLAEIPSLVDPALLALAVVALTYRRVPAALKLAALALALEMGFLFFSQVPAHPPEHYSTLPWGIGLQVGAVYLGAFAWLLVATAREPRSLQRERLGEFTVAFGAVLITRVPLLLVESAGRLPWGLEAAFVAPTDPRSPWWTPWWLTLALAALTGLLFLLGWLAARPFSRAAVPKVFRQLGAALAAVAGIWLLATAPGTLRDISQSVWYIARWLVFAIIVAAGIHRLGLLDIGEKAERRLWRALASVAVLTTAGLLWPLLVGGDRADILLGLLFSLVLAALMQGMLLALLRSTPREPSQLDWRRMSLYRAHLELGTDEAELARLRSRLRIPSAQARKMAQLVEEEREAPSPVDALVPGHVFANRYEVQSVIGAGGFGRVLLAFDLVRHEKVVLKELLEGWRSEPKALARFRNEIRILLSVSHPNLVQFRDVERIAGGHVLVLQHIEGESLRHRLQSGTLAPREAKRLGARLLEGLEALHRLGVAHGDVKPENIVLRRNGTPVLLDFGAARVVAKDTRMEGVAGTDAYMDPQRRQGGQATPEADLFAVGVVLWESVAGRLPPGGAVPQPLRSVLERAMAHEPQRRWPDAAAMGKALGMGR